MLATLGLLLIMGAGRTTDEPRQADDEPRLDKVSCTDYRVLEAVLMDLLDPASPINKNVKDKSILQEIHLFHETLPAMQRFFLDQEFLDAVISCRDSHVSLPQEVGDDLRRRNAGRALTIGRSGFRSPRIKFHNIRLYYSDGRPLAEEDLDEETIELIINFRDIHPKSRGWYYAYAPGYSADMGQAVVVLVVFHGFHKSQFIYLLDSKEGKWIVKHRLYNII